jgi:hypothetical protein
MWKMISAYATRKCSHCGKNGIIMLEEEQLFKWLSGSLIQEAFPNISAPIREQIMTGMHPECWTEIFAFSEED